MQLKDKQFQEQLSSVSTDYKTIGDNIIVEQITKTIKNPSSAWSDTCHADAHSENGHFDCHSDSHPDCGGNNELLGNVDDLV